MKRLFASGIITLAMSGTAAHAQPVENIRPPAATTAESTYGDTYQSAPEVTARSERQDRRSGSGMFMYDSHNPAANSAKWGVGG
jgi:hypothetical protein